MALVGLAVGGLGLKLVTVGGSVYFLIMGVVMLIAAFLIARNRASGIILYAVAFIASLFWAVSDAGWDFWPLFSRLFTFAVLAFLAAIVWPFLRGISQPVNKAPAFGIAAVLAVAMLVSFGWMFKPQTLVTANEPVPVKPVAEGQQQKNWEHWGNTTHGDRFAALDQINKQNINELKVAWVAHTGDIPQSNGSGARSDQLCHQPPGAGEGRLCGLRHPGDRRAAAVNCLFAKLSAVAIRPGESARAAERGRIPERL
jgi:quinate dehydrogenase (quinone)